MMADMACAYCIENKMNGKRYVGVTRQFRRRQQQHLTGLRHGRHPNKPLQRDWDRFGESAFRFCVLEEITEETNTARLETRWIAAFRSGNGLYNIGSGKTRVRSDDPPGFRRMRLGLYADQFEGLDRLAREHRMTRVGLIRSIIDSFIDTLIDQNGKAA